MNPSALVVQTADTCLFMVEQTLELARDMVARLRVYLTERNQ